MTGGRGVGDGAAVAVGTGGTVGAGAVVGGGAAGAWVGGGAVGEAGDGPGLPGDGGTGGVAVPRAPREPGVGVVAGLAGGVPGVLVGVGPGGWARPSVRTTARDPITNRPTTAAIRSRVSCRLPCRILRPFPVWLRPCCVYYNWAVRPWTRCLTSASLSFWGRPCWGRSPGASIRAGFWGRSFWCSASPRRSGSLFSAGASSPNGLGRLPWELPW